MDTTETQQLARSRKSSGQRVFPLHLTPFENYMITDDRPKYPMTFIVQFDFSGSLNSKAFADAIDQALAGHPLLRAVVRPAKSNRDCWVDTGNVRPMVHFGKLGEPLEFPGAGIEHIDLRQEPGLRIWVRSDEDRVELIGQFHHASVDGIGAYQFLGDVLAHYASRVGDETTGQSPVYSLVQLRNRGRNCYDPGNFIGENGRYRSELKYMANVMFGRVAAMRPRVAIKAGGIAKSPFPGILSFEFNKNEHRKLRLASQKRGQMINDLLLEKLFQTFDQRATKQNRLFGNGKICIMMPLDLREPDLEYMSACNVVTYAFIRRGGKMLKQPEKLKESLGEETMRLKHERHQTDFMNLVVASQRYPRILKAMLSRDHCLASAILSNTGDPTKRFLVDLPRENGMVRCGNLLLTSISGVPPMRISTRATISVFTYQRVLKICLRCDPNIFDIEETQFLLDQYVDNIRSVLSVLDSPDVDL